MEYMECAYMHINHVPRVTVFLEGGGGVNFTCIFKPRIFSEKTSKSARVVC